MTKLGRVVFKRGKKGDLDTRMSDVEARMGDAEKRLPPKGKKSPPAALTAKDVKQLVADAVGSVDFSASINAEVKAALKREHEHDREVMIGVLGASLRVQKAVWTIPTSITRVFSQLLFTVISKSTSSENSA